MKRERKMFRTRIVWGWTEFSGFLKDGWKYALIFSVIFAGVGLVIPLEWLVALSIVSIIMVISGFYQAGSFIYLTAAAVALGWLFDFNEWSANLGFINYDGYYIAWEWLLPVALLAGGFVIAEGLMISKNGAPSASPRLQKSPRGLKAAAYDSKRLWLIPVLLAVPGSLIEEVAPYWPQIPIGQSSFSFILFPFVFGFQNRARKTLPVYLYPAIGKMTWKLGVGIAVLALASLLWEPLAIIALILGVIGRLVITLYFEMKERQGNHAVTPHSQGLMIVDVLPDSPAHKMGLLRGEVIRKVNGLSVSNETELYEAIQVNAAHCRLEVLDHSHEVRLRQHIIFRHDHHRLGLIVVN
ncbi:PDZ domain-containing protein [Planococcus shenhongbingii]|uniref:PDZ domain-containing protein n=1 Tax=Planococcus shenhongbingii TaxID=3058398 RepID=A0ABT8N992_9BACL|nr:MULTISPECIES: PDZ domain-containing protein [unclassified Planococcus (in: firmicutes)]MDN7244431.1 PDZ domain-containing protein [Planococcus sp. N017]WKA57594.1 PDZ domain-containing protein [Planococcus sp. N016]